MACFAATLPGTLDVCRQGTARLNCRKFRRLCLHAKPISTHRSLFLGMPERVLQVPPMPPERTEHVIKQELGVNDLGELFDWIDLEQPLGSASISQVGH